MTDILTGIDIRPARAGELAAVAELRRRWAMENGREPAGTREEFVRHFTDWARRNAASHRCLVAVRGEAVLGMAWLALVPRVPTPHAPERFSGDVQSVYVVPGERDAGLGGLLVDAVVDLARGLGAERVTVHSSVRAVPVYTRHGFTGSPRLLQTEATRTRR
ncbi:GNAT family N-acetyltransferase [Streptomyces carminius]|uniref:GNAT family N-acetyltransferase n=1 Tax=Streptomyces carminius TaxID=2665496 RepID=A0A2M8M1H2_9ACTN|nr:GNAT family N-acetyltransferase [Streptomyces carminius]PJE98045.1 GNAT family N-acetyltransferase [Streptomyces carminius]PJF01871.1 GNAT family N-acetyltransferase [Streptomyces carminius]